MEESSGKSQKLHRWISVSSAASESEKPEALTVLWRRGAIVLNFGEHLEGVERYATLTL